MLNNDLTAIGLDISRRAVRGAAANAEAEGFGSSCSFYAKDARGLRQVCGDASLDAVVTNVPWGVQTGRHADLDNLYEGLLRTSWWDPTQLHPI